MLTEAEATEIYEMEKVIQEDWEWEHHGRNWVGEATVSCIGSDILLTLYGRYNREYSFSLVYRGSKVIRRWDNGKHKNPDGKWIEGSHKHKWTKQHEDTLAYEVDDINTSNVNQAFHDFLEESNITLQGTYNQIQTLDQ